MRSILAVLVAVTLPLHAQQSSDRKGADAPAEKQAPFVFEAGTTDLQELVARCARYLHRNILFDDRELAAVTPQPARRGGRRQPAAAEAAEEVEGPAVTLAQPVVTDAAGCEDLLSSLLWRHGLAIVPLDEDKAVYEVIAMAGQRGGEVILRALHRTPEQVLARPALRMYVTVVYEFEYINAQYANNSLRPFFMGASGQTRGHLMIGSVGNQNSMLLSGPQDVVAQALRVLRSADTRPRDLEQRLEERLQRIEAKLGIK